jgi:hypothetical protein
MVLPRMVFRPPITHGSYRMARGPYRSKRCPDLVGTEMSSWRREMKEAGQQKRRKK